MQSTTQTLHKEKTLVHRAKLEPATFAEIYENFLIWEEEGIVYVIRSDAELTLDDLLTIARSLAP